MKQKLIPSSINHYMVGFVHSLHMQSDLNPKKKVHPFSGGGVFFVPDCRSVVLSYHHYVKLWSTTRDDGRFIEISNSSDCLKELHS